jgi:uncharacterized membrane protein
VTRLTDEASNEVFYLLFSSTTHWLRLKVAKFVTIKENLPQGNRRQLLQNDRDGGTAANALLAPAGSQQMWYTLALAVGAIVTLSLIQAAAAVLVRLVFKQQKLPPALRPPRLQASKE